MFDYDANTPLNIEEAEVEDRDGIAVHDITFASPIPDSDPVRAYLVVPPGDGPFAGVLFVHWLGESSASRVEFMDDALALAEQGTVSLLVDAACARGRSFLNRDLEHDRAVSIKQVVDLRRALDVLAMPELNVDPARIALVGHDFGAMYGSILASVDRRPGAYVLIAGTISLSEWFLPFGRGETLDDAQTAAYIEGMSVFDPIANIAQANPAAVLFQFSRGDYFVPEDKALAYYLAASTPRRLELYDLNHDMGVGDDGDNAATEARLQWLETTLTLGDPE
jgi:dienelactone hydrolase